MDIEKDHIVSVLGQRNSGKSVLLDFLMFQMTSFINLDLLGEHKIKGAVVVHTPKQLVSALNQGYNKIHVHDPNLIDEGTLNEYLGIHGQLKNTFLVIDEIQKWTNANYCPSKLSDFVQVHSSHMNCGVIVATRQATPIPREIWSETNHYCIFHYGRSRDAKIEKLPVDDNTKKIIHNLDPESYRFLHLSDETSSDPEVMERVDASMIYE